MHQGLIMWGIYEIRSEDSSLNGVMLRGRIRKFGLENGINVLVENTEDMDNSVRFAVANGDDADKVIGYLNSILSDVAVKLVLEGVCNPVLSKLKVNDESRYTL